MLADLVQYNHAANLRVIDAFRDAGKPLPEAEKLFSHILNSQLIWIDRINKRQPKVERLQSQPLNDFLSLQNECTAGLTAILNHADPREEITYKDSKGVTFVNTVSDILFHVINHSTYHRGQVAALFRKNDIQPPVTDYIVYKRKGQL